jgi:cobalt-zinc-cadmium efflux system outer membrane protein
VSGFVIAHLQAQTIQTLNDVVQLALKNNIRLQNQNILLKKSESRFIESSRLPNPVFSYSREDMSLNNAKLGEWVATGTLPLNFLWDRWSNINAKDKSLEAQRYFVEHSKRSVILQVKNIYAQYHYYQQLSKELDSARTTIEEIVTASKQRLTDGDLSEYDVQRILIEVNKLKTEMKEIELLRNDYLQQLILMTGFSQTQLQTEEIHTAPSKAIFTEHELVKMAFENRQDLKSAQHHFMSESSNLIHNKLKSIPQISLSAGYKKQFDEYSGSVVQVNFEIPLFNRNQMEIEHSKLDVTFAEQQSEYLKQQIEGEVKLAYAKYKQYESLHNSKDDFQLHSVFKTAAYSYKEGGLTLIEFIDALNVYKEGVKLNTDLEIKYRQSIFELEYASALTSIEKIK